jgi:hypothetical protein
MGPLTAQLRTLKTWNWKLPWTDQDLCSMLDGEGGRPKGSTTLTHSQWFSEGKVCWNRGVFFLKMPQFAQNLFTVEWSGYLGGKRGLRGPAIFLHECFNGGRGDGRKVGVL